MEKKGIMNFDILLYALGIISTFLLLIISNKLSAPLIIEMKSGASVIDLMFNSEDNIKFSLHLFIPLLLLTIGIIILIISLWNLVKNIIFEENIMINKILMGILSIILVAVLIKAVISGWTLFLLALACIFISFVIFALLGSLFNGTSDTQKG